MLGSLHGDYDRGAFIFSIVWAAMIATLGFVTIVWFPKWVVGPPRQQATKQ